MNQREFRRGSELPGYSGELSVRFAVSRPVVDDTINDQNFGDLCIGYNFRFGEGGFDCDHFGTEWVPIGILLYTSNFQGGPSGKGASVDPELGFPIGGLEGFFECGFTQ